MTKAEIQSLLDNFDYKTALQAYLPYCSNASLKKLLESSANSPNTFTIKKLRESLRSLMITPDSQQPKVNLQVDVLPAKNQTHNSSHILGEVVADRRGLKEAYHSAPLEVQKKISERIALVSEARLIRSKLHSMTDLERREGVLTIPKNFQKAQLCYEYEQYWDKHGVLKPEPQKKGDFMLPDQTDMLLKRRNTLRTYKSRNSNWSKYEPEFNAIQAELAERGVS